MVKPKLQYFDHLMWHADSLENALMLECWRQMEKRAAEDVMVRYHHQPNGHEFEQSEGDSAGQRSLACCSSQGLEELDMT